MEVHNRSWSLTPCQGASFAAQGGILLGASLVAWNIYKIDPTSISKWELAQRIIPIGISTISQVGLMMEGLKNNGSCSHNYLYHILSCIVIGHQIYTGKLNKYCGGAIFLVQVFLSESFLSAKRMAIQQEVLNLVTKLNTRNLPQENWTPIHQEARHYFSLLNNGKVPLDSNCATLFNAWLEFIAAHSDQIDVDQAVNDSYATLTPAQQNAVRWPEHGSAKVKLLALLKAFGGRAELIEQEILQLVEKLQDADEPTEGWEGVHRDTIDYIHILENGEEPRNLVDAWAKFIAAHPDQVDMNQAVNDFYAALNQEQKDAVYWREDVSADVKLLSILKAFGRDPQLIEQKVTQLVESLQDEHKLEEDHEKVHRETVDYFRVLNDGEMPLNANCIAIFNAWTKFIAAHPVNEAVSYFYAILTPAQQGAIRCEKTDSNEVMLLALLKGLGGDPQLIEQKVAQLVKSLQGEYTQEVHQNAIGYFRVLNNGKAPYDPQYVRLLNAWVVSIGAHAVQKDMRGAMNDFSNTLTQDQQRNIRWDQTANTADIKVTMFTNLLSILVEGNQEKGRTSKVEPLCAKVLASKDKIVIRQFVVKMFYCVIPLSEEHKTQFLQYFGSQVDRVRLSDFGPAPKTIARVSELSRQDEKSAAATLRDILKADYNEDIDRLYAILFYNKAHPEDTSQEFTTQFIEIYNRSVTHPKFGSDIKRLFKGIYDSFKASPR